MKHSRRGPFDGMLTRASALPAPRVFWSSPDVSPQNQTDLDAQTVRDAELIEQIKIARAMLNAQPIKKQLRRRYEVS